LTAIYADFTKGTQKEVFQSLKSKYKIKKHRTYSFDNINAELTDGNTVIRLITQHVSWEFQLQYLHKSFLDEALKAHRDEQKSKEEKRRNAL